jgi:hypothetical protein
LVTASGQIRMAADKRPSDPFLDRRQNGDTEVTWSHPDLGFLTSAACAEGKSNAQNLWIGSVRAYTPG